MDCSEFRVLTGSRGSPLAIRSLSCLLISQTLPIEGLRRIESFPNPIPLASGGLVRMARRNVTPLETSFYMPVSKPSKGNADGRRMSLPAGNQLHAHRTPTGFRDDPTKVDF